MASALSLRKLDTLAFVRPEALNVTPDLLGAPLAPHRRRVAAMALDLVVVALLSRTGEFWVAAGIGALVYQLRHRQGARSRWRAGWMWLALALLVFVGVQRGTAFVERAFAPAPAAAASAPGAQAREDDDDTDADLAAQAPAVARAAQAIAAAASAATPASSALAQQAAAALVAAQDAARIRQLEAQLAEARKPKAVRWRDRFVQPLREGGRSLGWAIAYFTLLPFWWKGQTVGKRVFGLRIVELTGKPLGLMTTFGRYGGYAAGMATGGTGFAQVLWDANRQAIQDKLAHTVVIDLRAARATPARPPSAVDAALEEPA